MTHHYSKLGIVVGLKQLGKWDAAKAAIVSAGYEDEWLAATQLSSDYPGFEDVVNGVCAACGMSRADLDPILVEAERAWMS